MNNTTNRDIHYFRIGVFFIVGIFLIIGTILFINAGNIFSHVFYIETCFNESIQGLSVGSAVKYRGLDIGYVKKIAFINEIYDIPATHQVPYNRYIYVQMAITSGFLSRNARHKKSFASQEINEGLRVRLSMQGLTGNAFAELNFVNPKINPPIPITWTPKDIYIPSAKSNLNQFSDNVQTILDNLKGVNFRTVFTDFQTITTTANRLMTQMDMILRRTDNDIVNSITSLERLLKNLNAFIERAKDSPSQTFLSKPPPPLNPEHL